MVFPSAFWDAPHFQAHFLFSVQDRFPRAEMLRLLSQFCERHLPCCVVGYDGCGASALRSCVQRRAAPANETIDATGGRSGRESNKYTCCVGVGDQHSGIVRLFEVV